MIGVPLGQLLAPPVGGALFARWGYRAPFIFTILFTVLDLPHVCLSTRTQSQLLDHYYIELTFLGIPPESCKSAEKHDVGGAGREEETSKELSLLQVICVFSTFFPSLAFAALDVTLPLRVQALWNLNSTKVGLVYLASLVPLFLAIESVLLGGDGSVRMWIPWFGLLTLDFSLAFFIVAFAVENFFIAATAAPLTTELAAVTRSMDGVGYAHTYGTLNIVFGLANAGK
ncbi:uncharacterized protein B0H18DRAFT_1118896 [Fomitopsis serialis]|uniref:uncharacterized protein n=1 Tax=Fomitopsis serialis TaxID=139415 RepID=UPI0020086773|nr:uncharacterized protein B0H18DRAFT_1118896 [Neoantrodia serialis]KAH9926391.1 hypothetical protein B0H18DRAFT_1118896 [Neoantrodia serialis]